MFSLKFLFILLFVFCVLYVVRHLFFLIRHAFQDTPKKYEIKKYDLIFLGMSIAFIITTIISLFV